MNHFFKPQAVSLGLFDRVIGEYISTFTHRFADAPKRTHVYPASQQSGLRASAWVKRSVKRRSLVSSR